MLIAAGDVLAQTAPEGDSTPVPLITQASGEQRVLVLFVDFPNAQWPASLSIADIADGIETTRSYYEENSYGKLELKGAVDPNSGADVFDSLRLPFDQSCPENGAAHVDEIAKTGVEVLSSQIQFAQYDHLVIVGPLAPCAGDGGARGMQKFDTAQGLVSLNVSFVSPAADWNDYDTWLLIHELGHNLGFGHAKFYNCPGRSLHDEGCRKIEYGDIYSAVGGMFPFGGHFNAAHKDMAGWLEESEIAVVSEDATFTLNALSAQGPGLKALKIPHSLNTYIYLEYRTPAGYDNFNPLVLGSSDIFQGAVLHVQDFFSDFPELQASSTLLIDGSPPDALEGAAEAVQSVSIGVGESYTDFRNDGSQGAIITVLEQTSSTLTVKVSFPADPGGSSVTDEADDGGEADEPEAVNGDGSEAADSDKETEETGSETADDGKESTIGNDSSADPNKGQVCVEWNGFLTFLTQIFELRNAGSETVLLEIALYDIAANAKDRFDLTLEPGIQFDVIVNNLNGFNRDTFGLLCARVLTGPANALAGRLMSYRLEENSYSLAFSSDPINPKSGLQFLTFNTFQPGLNQLENGVALWAQIVNAEPDWQSGSLILYDQQGRHLETIAVALAPNQRADIDLHRVGPSQIGLARWEPDNSSARFALRQNRYYFGAEGPYDLTEVVSIAAREGLENESAAIFDTRKRVSALELSNVLEKSTRVRIEIRGGNGLLAAVQPPEFILAPHAAATFVLNHFLDEQAGVVKIFSDTSGSVIANRIEYGYSTDGSLTYASTSRPRGVLNSSGRGSYNSFLGQSCRMRAANLSARDNKTYLSMTRYDGIKLLDRREIIIPAHQVREIDLCANETQPAYGEVLLEISDSHSLIAEVIRQSREGKIEIGAQVKP